MRLITRLARPVAGLALFVGLPSLALGGSVGYLQVDGRVSVQPEGVESPIRISQNNYTVFSGDRLLTTRGSVVLVLNNGGVLGLTPSSVLRVSTSGPADDLTIDLERGTLLYALPASATQTRIQVDDFRLQPQADGEGMLQVSAQQHDFSGMVERFDDGHIRVSVRNGDMRVSAGGNSRYLVAAGEQIGLLASAAVVERVAIRESLIRLVEFEAPERVNTNEGFRVRWYSEDFPEDSYITIAPSGSDPEEFESVVSTSEGDVLEFNAPGSPGDYEIRFIDGNSGLVTDFVYLQVVGDGVIVPWYTSRLAIAGISFVGGLTTAWLICDCGDDDDDPVSP